MRVLLFANTSWYLWNFRKNLIDAFVERGDEVFTVAPEDDYSLRLKNVSNFVPLRNYNNLSRNPLRELSSLHSLFDIYRRIRPHFAFHFTTKPVIYGSLVAMALKVNYINTVTGLGTLFVSSSRTMVSRAVLKLHRFIARRAFHTFFQNPDDASLIAGLSQAEKKILFRTYPDVPAEVRFRHLSGKWDLVPGSGVDLEKFSPDACEKMNRRGSFRRLYDFVYTGRLLKEKGLTELAYASRLLHRETDFKVLIVGIPYPGNPSYIPPEELKTIFPEDVLIMKDPTDDVVKYLCQGRFFVLPTYGEGLPRSLLEAMAVGLPGIASDVQGCNLLIKDGENGFTFSPRDVESLCGAMKMALELDPETYTEFSVNARRRAEIFSTRNVLKKYLSVL